MGSQPYAPGVERPEGLRVNGSLALGITRRCCELLGPSSLDDELRQCRDDLDAFETKDISISRARAAELAVRAAHVLAVSRGSQSAISGDIAERTTREAALLLVFGSRPAIKESLLDLMIDRAVVQSTTSGSLANVSLTTSEVTIASARGSDES